MFKFLTRLFEGSMNIERAYKTCDSAIGLLQSYNGNPDGFSENKKADMNETVEKAIQEATQLIGVEGERNWTGVFREMHKNLASIYFELGDYDKVHHHCDQLTSYGEVGRYDAEEVLEKLNESPGSTESNTSEDVTATQP